MAAACGQQRVAASDHARDHGRKRTWLSEGWKQPADALRSSPFCGLLRAVVDDRRSALQCSNHVPSAHPSHQHQQHMHARMRTVLASKPADAHMGSMHRPATAHVPMACIQQPACSCRSSAHHGELQQPGPLTYTCAHIHPHRPLGKHGCISAKLRPCWAPRMCECACVSAGGPKKKAWRSNSVCRRYGKEYMCKPYFAHCMRACVL